MHQLKEIIKKYNTVFVVAVLLLAGLSLYANSFNNEMFWDDDDGILNNSFIKDWSYFPKYFSENMIAGAGLVSNYWRPVLLLVYSIEWHLWGEAVQGYHAVNTLVHIGNAILAYFLLKRLFKGRLMAFLASFIFLIHPLQTEAVTYVSGLGDPLSTLFILSGLILYLKFKGSGKKFWLSGQYYLSLFFFTLALMTKEPSVIMPGLILLADLFSNSQEFRNSSFTIKKWLPEAIKNVAPFIFLAAAYLLLRGTVLNFSNTFNVYGEENAITSNFFYRLYIFFNAFVEYIRLLFLPTGLHMERSYEFLENLSPLKGALGGAGAAGLLTLAVTQLKKYPVVSFGILWFFIRLLPNSNLLVPNSGLIYEHWLYLPMLGIWALLVWLGIETAKFSIFNFQFSKIVAGVLAIFVVLISVQTIRRNAEWQNPIRFYEQTLPFAPQSYRVLNNLGMAYAENKHYGQAEETYLKAITIEAGNPVAIHNLANNYRNTGRFEEAISTYRRAIELDPDFIFSYQQLLKLYLALAEHNYKNKDIDKSVSYLKQALILAPNEIAIANTIRYLESQPR